MAGYCHDHNSVAEVPFQISHNLPQQVTLLKQQISADYLCALIARDPRCTLKQLCDWIAEERSITLSKSAMSRLVKGYRLKRQRSHRPHSYPIHSLALTT